MAHDWPWTLQRSSNGTTPIKNTPRVRQRSQKIVKKAEPSVLKIFEFHDLRLQSVRLEFKLKNGERVTGRFPIVVSRRYPNPDGVDIAFHPMLGEDWFLVTQTTPLEEQANAYFKTSWRLQDLDAIKQLLAPKYNRLKTVSFSISHRSLLEELEKKGEKRTKLGPQKIAGGALQVLPQVGIDLTTRASDRDLDHPRPRIECREVINRRMQGESRRAVVLIGAPSVGKRCLIMKFVYDLLDRDDFKNHGDVNECERVWSVSGRRIIAGMSYVGQWEERCVELLADLERQRAILHVTDIHAWGRIGQSTSSARCLADFFRGPVARGECAVIASCTPERWMRLQADSPAFADLFTVIDVRSMSEEETFSLLMDRVRELESTSGNEFPPVVLRTILELSESVLTSRAFPGKAIELLDTLADDHKGMRIKIGSYQVFESVARRTGMPTALLQSNTTLDLEILRAQFARYVRGQDEPVDACIDVVARIKAGLCEPRRPYQVMMFTGPTGTGKTELAKCLAAYLYGDVDRLIRFDMSEFAGPDAVSRLAGDRFEPDGLLTSSVRNQPFSVVLLDEIEKAHPSALNLLLQVFDEGRLADAEGRVADFSHTVIILTSNLGAQATSSVGFTEGSESPSHDFVKAVEAFFSPELFNRIDRVLGFVPLSRESARKIALKELQKLLGRHGLLERRIFVKPTDSVIEKIVDDGFDKRDGARSLKRYLEQTIGARLADSISKGGQAEMRFFHAYVDSNNEFALHTESLRESETSAESQIEHLLTGSKEELDGALRAAKKYVESVIDSDELKDAGEVLSTRLSAFNVDEASSDADSVYAIDTLNSSLRLFVADIDRLLGADLADDAELIEGRLSRRVELKGSGKWKSPLIARWFNPNDLKKLRNPPSRVDVMLLVAESRFLSRTLPRIDDPALHQTIVILSQIGDADNLARFSKADKRFIDTLAEGFVQGRGKVVDVAGILDDEVISGSEVFARRPKTIVISIVGFGISEWLGVDTGTHSSSALGETPEAVRVEVRPFSEQQTTEKTYPAVRTAEQLLVSRREFLLGLESGYTVKNPETLLPILRTYSIYREPTQSSVSTWIFDYKIGWAGQLVGKKFASVADQLRAMHHSAEKLDG